MSTTYVLLARLFAAVRNTTGDTVSVCAAGKTVARRARELFCRLGIIAFYFRALVFAYPVSVVRTRAHTHAYFPLIIRNIAVLFGE